MKKLIFLTVALIFSYLIVVFNTACAKANPLTPMVSELRSDIFEGASQNYQVKAFYGFIETPFCADGKVGKTTYALSFKLTSAYSEPATYYLTLIYNGTTYKEEFSLSPTGALVCKFEIENFNKKEFSVGVTKAESTEKVAMKSLVDTSAITHNKVLDLITGKYKDLLTPYYIGDKFNAELQLRVVVKDGKTYWFVGISNADGLKAFLIDGKSGELLAVREVY